MNSSSTAPKVRGLGITARTALLAWAVALVTLLIFVAALLPEQHRTFLDNLRSKAYGVTVSLRDVAAGAVVNEDYSSVVDHCTEMLKGDLAIDYIVITRNDGFSLVHDRSGWQTRQLDARWRPAPRLAAGAIEVVPVFARRVYAFSQPFDYSGIEWGWIHVGLSLTRHDENLRHLYRQTALVAVICIVFSLIASTLYARRLVRPVLDLQEVVRRVAAGDLSARAVVTRTDELGRLAASVNEMTDALLRRDRTLKEANETLELRVDERTRELQEQVAAKERARTELAAAQTRLMNLSREAGMAEVATGVLHNVGNVLNSVNVSTSLMRERLTGARVGSLERAVGLLRTHEAALPEYLGSDPQGRQIVPFLAQLARHLAEENAFVRNEIESVCRHVDHIKEIVAMQQSYARPGGLVENVAPAELFEDALRIKEESCRRHRIVVERQFAAVPSISVERHRVIQILVNLLANAVTAIKAGANPDRRLILGLAAGEGGRVRLVVRDTGVGISADNLNRIFTHGFTTRRDGHGFGLHSGAIAAKTLGGTLAVESAGPGQGATFTLELPVQSVTFSP